jgi:agmatinase
MHPCQQALSRSPEARVALLGLPHDMDSSFLRGAAQAPGAVRRVLFSPAGNLWTEDGKDLGRADGLVDCGDADVAREADRDAAGAAMEAAARAVFAAGRRPLFLGGDHGVTLHTLRAAREMWPELAVLHLDAHPDLYDELDGNRRSHACTFARAMEEGLVDRLVQVGVRAMTGHQREQALRFGAQVHEMRFYPAGGLSLRFQAPVYVSLDLDVLDPACAPGVSHPEPGGLSVRQVLDILQTLKGRVVAADVVELNPDRDPQGVTASAAAKLVKELAGRMLLERGGEE